MMQWIVTSCLLILAVLLLRAVGRDRLSARARYALWVLVLVRLLVPFSFGESSLSVMNLVLRDEAAQQIEIPETPVISDLPDASDATGTFQPSDTIVTTETITATKPTVETAPAVPLNIINKNADISAALHILWFAGFAMSGAILLSCNLRLNAALKRSRKAVPAEGCPLPVYETAVVETPCMFGLVRPAVYIIPELTEDESALRHVLTHEVTHYRHRDHIWSLLRCVCLAVHWYNPLVWVAAYLSREDAELACDEGALKRIGDTERTAYGETLIALTCTGHSGLMTTATTMTGSKGGLKERIKRIADRRKSSLIVLLVVLLLAVIAAVAMFTGQRTDVGVEGIWRTTVSVLGEGVEPGSEGWMEYEFENGTGSMHMYQDGVRFGSYDLKYTLEDDTIAITILDEGGNALREQEYTWLRDGDTLTLSNPRGEIVFERIERPELEGVWRAVGSVLAEGYEDTPEEDWLDYEFRSGEGRRVYYYDGFLSQSRRFTYTVDGDTVTLRYAEDWIGDAGEETLRIEGDRLIGTSDFSQPITFSPNPVNNPEFLTDALFVVDSVSTRVTGRAQQVSLRDNDNYSAYLMKWFREADVTVLKGAASAVPAGDSAYVFHGSEQTLYLVDRVLYDGTNGYVLSNIDEIYEAMIDTLHWFPVEPDTDAEGLSYYEADADAWDNTDLRQTQVFIQMAVPAGMGDHWFYIPENQSQWREAMADAVANAVTDKPQELEGREPCFWIHDYPTDTHLVVYDNGTFWYFETLGPSEYVNYYMTADAAPALSELVAYYVDLYSTEEARGASDETAYYGYWMLDGTIPEYGVTDLILWSGAAIAWTENGVVTETYRSGVLDGQMVFRFADGTTSQLPHSLQGDTLVLEINGVERRFTKLEQPYAQVLALSDVIQHPQSGALDYYPQTLSDSQLQRLESLIRTGLNGAQPGEKQISADTAYYRLPCLNELLNTTQLIMLTDSGTLHYNGQAYVLTNAEEVLTFLGRFFPEAMTAAQTAASAVPETPAEALAGIRVDSYGLHMALAEGVDPLLMEHDGSYADVENASNAEHFLEYCLKLYAWEEVERENVVYSQPRQAVLFYGENWYLTACEDEEYVWFVTANDVGWYLPTSAGEVQDVYSILRSWYDEVEYGMLYGGALYVSDAGQSYLEAAESLISARDALHLQVTSGSKNRFSYVQSTVVDEEFVRQQTERMRERGEIGENEYCIYVETVFVPENEAALSWNMAGNTVEYTGDDPNVPEGALQRSTCFIVTQESDRWMLSPGGTSW